MLDPKNCLAGQEQHEEFYSTTADAMRIQYDYRSPEGQLFSCIAKSLEMSRQKRDRWLEVRDLPAAADVMGWLSRATGKQGG